MAEQADEQTLRQELAEQYKQLGAAGLNELSSGNVSCRIGDDMLISPSGASADTIEAGAVVRMSLDGNSRHPAHQRSILQPDRYQVI